MNKLKSIIPSAITGANLLCGVAVLFLDLKYGVILILLGGFLDLWDGLAARLLNAQSEFGAQLDSLADLITFCVAPAFLLYYLLDEPFQYICFLIPLTGAIRLAKFNISTDQSYYFKGLATPSSGFLFAGIYLAKENVMDFPLLIVLLVILACLLNVSNIKMFSIKGIKKDPFTKYYLAILAIIAAIALIINWKMSLMLTIGAYLVLSLIYNIQMTKRLKV